MSKANKKKQVTRTPAQLEKIPEHVTPPVTAHAAVEEYVCEATPSQDSVSDSLLVEAAIQAVQQPAEDNIGIHIAERVENGKPSLGNYINLFNLARYQRTKTCSNVCQCD